jgi:hypothetical protein
MKIDLGQGLRGGVIRRAMSFTVHPVGMSRNGEKIRMHNRLMLMRSLCPMCMFIARMQMESRQHQQGGKEDNNNPRLPGRQIIAQHDPTLLLLVSEEKSLCCETCASPG